MVELSGVLPASRTSGTADFVLPVRALLFRVCQRLCPLRTTALLLERTRVRCEGGRLSLRVFGFSRRDPAGWTDRPAGEMAGGAETGEIRVPGGGYWIRFTGRHLSHSRSACDQCDRHVRHGGVAPRGHQPDNPESIEEGAGGGTRPDSIAYIHRTNSSSGALRIPDRSRLACGLGDVPCHHRVLRISDFFARHEHAYGRGTRLTPFERLIN